MLNQSKSNLYMVMNGHFHASHKVGLHEYNAPGRQDKFYRLAPDNVWDLSMDLASYHPPDECNFEVSSALLENLCRPDRSHFQFLFL